MTHRIILEFESASEAKHFCVQMSDGFGEGVCDFSRWRQKPNTDGTKKQHFEEVFGSAPEGTQIYFVKDIEKF